MSCAGALLCCLNTASMAVSVAASVDASLAAVQCFLLSSRAVAMATDDKVPIDAIPVAIVSIAVVPVSYSVIYQGSVLVLTELADQLGL